VLGAEHPDTLTSMSNLATSHQKAGRVAQAIPLFETAYRLRKANLGPSHVETRKSMAELRAAYIMAGRNAEADAILADPRAGVSGPP
jgi:hypothetical protein